MKIRLSKKWRTWPIGQVLEIVDPTAKQMIMEGTAERYTGEYPPKQKMRTEFFKPIKTKGNGKNKR